MQKAERCLGYLADHIFPTPHFDRRRPPSTACSESTNLQKNHRNINPSMILLIVDFLGWEMKEILNRAR